MSSALEPGLRAPLLTSGSRKLFVPLKSHELPLAAKVPALGFDEAVSALNAVAAVVDAVTVATPPVIDTDVFVEKLMVAAVPCGTPASWIFSAELPPPARPFSIQVVPTSVKEIDSDVAQDHAPLTTIFAEPGIFVKSSATPHRM